MEERTPVLGPAWTRRRVTAAILALAAVGLGRAAYFHLVVERRSAHPPPIDDRYRALRALLPPAGAAGYVSDRRVARVPSEYERSPGTRMYIEAQYAVTPVILKVDDDRADLVVVNAADPGAVPGLLDRRDLRPVADTGHGVVLVRPRSR